MSIMTASQVEEDTLIAKLDVIKDVRSKTMQLEKVKARILHQLQSVKTEEQHISAYRTEMENLKRERLMHIEALRLIERDLSIIENTMVESEHARENTRERVFGLFQEYNPLKQEIDMQRVQIGLDKLTEIPQNEQLCKQSYSARPGNQHHVQTTDTARVSCSTSPQHGMPILSPSSAPSFVAISHHSKYQNNRPRRQQPPPMKTCSTCQELIHRNAPVCPMCKTKSTSKQSKKPRKNDNGDCNSR